MRIKVERSGLVFPYWSGITVTCSIDTLCGRVVLRTARSSQFQIPKEWDECKIFVDDLLAMTAVIYDINGNENSDQKHNVEIIGRDKTADLVDSSVDHKSGEWKNITIDKLAREICKPFDIPVVIDADVGAAFPKISLQNGESAFELLDRAATERKINLGTTADGELWIYKAGQSTAFDTIEEGKNVESFDYAISVGIRHSTIQVRSQDGNNGSPWEKKNIAQEGRCTDPDCPRYRPLIIVSDEKRVGLSQRARNEVNIRKRRALSINVVIDSWTKNDGTLWLPGECINTKIPSILINGTPLDKKLMASTVTYTDDENDGEKCIITLSPVEAA